MRPSRALSVLRTRRRARATEELLDGILQIPMVVVTYSRRIFP